MGKREKLVTLKIKESTHQALKTLNVLTGENMGVILERLLQEELRQEIERQSEGGKRSTADILLNPKRRV